MANSGWYVVKFRNEKNVIEVIPSNWIVNFEKCQWPTKFGSIKLQAAIKNRLTPSAIGWKMFPIRVICKHMFLTYDDASDFANTTLAISSSESDAFVVNNAPTKHKKKSQLINYNSSSSDEEQSAVELPTFPVFTEEIFEQTRKNSAEESNNEIRQSVDDEIKSYVNDQAEIMANTHNGNNIENMISVADQNFSHSVNTHVNVQAGIMANAGNDNDIESMISRADQDFNCSVNSYVNDQAGIMDNGNAIENLIPTDVQNFNHSEFQRQVMRQLVTLNARAVEHSKYFDILMLMVNDIKQKLEKVQEINPGNIDRQELENIFLKLPVSNEDTLTSLTEALAESTFFNDETIKMLSMIGGSSFKERVRRILRKLITDEFAKLFSYTGHKGNKKSFKNTILSSLLIKTVQSTCTNASVKDIELVASVWLTKARERFKPNNNNF